MKMIVHRSEAINGLEIVVDYDTGKVYASHKALALLIGEQPDYVLLFEESLRYEARFEKVVTTVITGSGPQEVTLYGVDFICRLLAKYKPELLAELAQIGFTVLFYRVSGYRVTMTEDQC